MSEHIVDYLYFGPLLMKSSVEEDFRLELLKRASKLHMNHNDNLAGHIEKEYCFDTDDKHYFMDKMKPYMERYINDLNKYINLSKPKKHCELKNLWVNYMQKGEYNPPHIHGDSLSFVIYLDVPQEITNESNNYTATHEGPGTVDFMFGETMPDIRNHYNIKPKNGDLFLFNALLKHWVAPFKSQKTRISMAGNFLLTT